MIGIGATSLLASLLAPPLSGSLQYRAANAQKSAVSQRIRIATHTEQVYSLAHVYRRGIGSGDSGIDGALGCGHAPLARMCSPIRCRMWMGSTRGRVVRALVVLANWARSRHRAREGGRSVRPRQPARHRCRPEVGPAVVRAMWMIRALTRISTPDTEAKLLEAAL